ncbi:hypothetical protein GE061_009168 [Apolygus lucorum]|uniref:Uncharacterized protein n=1 Tax=Apolygus lucorum TaxID=248454 RepID=A0A8S9Y3J1_APOLU|nr:hypothetical protein GE061_009168 [Apolygus lucorum]
MLDIWEAYTRQLDLLSADTLSDSLPLQDAMDLLTDRIIRAARGSGMGMEGCPDRREPWWDWVCTRARKKSFALLNLFRLSDSQLSRTAYLKQNAVYKTLCERKRTEYYEGLAAWFADVRDSSGFWGLIRSLRTVRQQRVGDVPMTAWMQYFSAQWSLANRVAIARDCEVQLATNIDMNRY